MCGPPLHIILEQQPLKENSCTPLSRREWNLRNHKLTKVLHLPLWTVELCSWRSSFTVCPPLASFTASTITITELRWRAGASTSILRYKSLRLGMLTSSWYVKIRWPQVRLMSVRQWLRPNLVRDVWSWLTAGRLQLPKVINYSLIYLQSYKTFINKKLCNLLFYMTVSNGRWQFSLCLKINT